MAARDSAGHVRARAASGAAEDLPPRAVRPGRMAVRLLRVRRWEADARPRRTEIARRRLRLGERRHVVRSVQPAQGRSHARGERAAPAHEAETAGAGAVHSPRRTEDPARLEALPARSRVGDFDGRGLVSTLARQIVALLPLAPRAWIEPPLAAGEVE